MIPVYLVAHDVTAFYALAIVFGISYGGVMPLYALVTREYFGEKVMGTAYGAVFLISTLGMGIGSYAGGILYDRLGSYAWLYSGSFVIGAVAVSLALTFRPPRTAAPPGSGTGRPVAVGDGAASRASDPPAWSAHCSRRSSATSVTCTVAPRACGPTCWSAWPRPPSCWYRHNSCIFSTIRKTI